ncbi:MAG: hypothetical protein OEY98_13675 [Acidimicrobiia bacterium]|nr:hypothetical protein [Acidimicrobiia bacterium]
MNLLRKLGSTLVIAGLVLMVAAPAVSNNGATEASQSDQVAGAGRGTADESDPIVSEAEAADANGERADVPAASKREGSVCPVGQARVVQGNHLGQCVATATASATSVVSSTSGAATAQTVIKKVVIQIVQRSCEVRNGISETNVTFSFRHNGLNTTDKVEMTIDGPTGVIVISEKTEFELPEGTYNWTARSIDSGYEIDGPSSGQLVVLACQTGSTTTSSTTTSSTTTSSTTTSSTTTTVPVSATTITSPTTTSSSTTSSTSTSSTSSTTSSSTTSTTVPDSECEPPDCLPYTGPSDVSWPLGIFGVVLLVLGMGTLTIGRTLEERRLNAGIE